MASRTVGSLRRAAEDLARAAAPLVLDDHTTLELALEYGANTWADRDARPVYGRGDVQDAEFAIDDGGCPLEDILTTIDASVVRPGLNATSPRHFGWIPGGSLYASAVGDYLAALTNEYAGLALASPGAVAMEVALLRWMASAIGFPESSSGDLTSGGSMATAIALHVASPRVRRAHAARTEEGAGGERSAPQQLVMPEDLRGVVYRSAEAHGCIDASLRFTGHGGEIREIPVDESGRMDAAALQRAIDEDRSAERPLTPWLVVATAGTTNRGAVDPQPAIADVAKAEGLWLHVDAAYGGFFALCEDGKRRLEGMERADSIVLDPHKGLFQPYGLGAVLVRDGPRLQAAYEDEHPYIGTDRQASRSAMNRSPEMTRHFRALRLWLPLKRYGVAPFRAALAARLLLARYAWEFLDALPGVEVGAPPDLSVVPFRFRPAAAAEESLDDLNSDKCKRLYELHGVFLTKTQISQRTWIRLAILSVHTRAADVEQALEAIRAIASSLENEG